MADPNRMAIEAIREHYDQAVARADMLDQLRAVAVERANNESTRAEAAEAELRELQEEVDEVASACGRWKPLTDSVGAAVNEMVNELQALTAELEKASELRKLVDAWKAADLRVGRNLFSKGACEHEWAMREALRHA